MIKLFWNTHNQNKPNEKEDKDYIWGIYHKNNSDKWIFEILDKVQFKLIQSEKELETNDTLIIVDSSIEKKNEYYDKLKLICSKIYLIHLGDEGGAHDLSSIYKNCNYIWRVFCLNKYFNNKKVSCIPLGYKSGTLFDKQVNGRKYKWAFIGTPHKSSRHDLLFQLSNIRPSMIHKTDKFNVKIIEVHEMSKILSSTEFIPCPNGFVHPESYRLYEALECGCIPIVENAYKYYERLFPNNPFIKVDRWIEAKSVIREWGNDKIKQKRAECREWWSQYKKQIQEFIVNKINL